MKAGQVIKKRPRGCPLALKNPHDGRAASTYSSSFFSNAERVGGFGRSGGRCSRPWQAPSQPGYNYHSALWIIGLLEVEVAAVGRQVGPPGTEWNPGKRYRFAASRIESD